MNGCGGPELAWQAAPNWILRTYLLHYPGRAARPVKSLLLLLQKTSLHVCDTRDSGGRIATVFLSCLLHHVHVQFDPVLHY